MVRQKVLQRTSDQGVLISGLEQRVPSEKQLIDNGAQESLRKHCSGEESKKYCEDNTSDLSIRERKGGQQHN